MTEPPPLHHPPDATLDACGLICPMPVLKARRAMRALPDGGVLQVLATDAAALKDMPDFCKMAGHRLLSVRSRADGVHEFILEKAPEIA